MSDFKTYDMLKFRKIKQFVFQVFNEDPTI